MKQYWAGLMFSAGYDIHETLLQDPWYFCVQISMSLFQVVGTFGMGGTVCRNLPGLGICVHGVKIETLGKTQL